jgi:hypothetical protein
MRAQQLALACMGAAMIPHQVVASGAQHAHQQLQKRGLQPLMSWDLNTIKTCTYWYDNDRGIPCQEVRDLFYAISPADFSRWNPSITLDCGNWGAHSYCVEVKSEQTSSSTSSTPSATSTTTSATPTATRKPELLGWEPLGCYVDNQTLFNHTTKAGGKQLTVDACEAACFSDDFEYAGVKAGQDCWCGTFVGNSWTENQDDCNMPCPGNASEICGGASVFNVFAAKTKNTLPPISTTWSDAPYTPISTTTTKTTSTAVATPTWKPLGCHRDLFPSSQRTLNTTASYGATMTPALCQATCLKLSLPLAGVEAGNQCFCGSAIQSPDANAPAAEGECSAPCAGDAAQQCGASARIYLYRYVVPAVTWVPLGCYGEEPGRVLRNLVGVPGGQGNNTRENCQQSCDKAGFGYAGVQDGGQCWCDVGIQAPGALAVDGAVGW